jgi:hypothetical protein
VDLRGRNQLVILKRCNYKKTLLSSKKKKYLGDHTTKYREFKMVREVVQNV